MNKTYDVVILGGGIGGYSAAIRASQLGKKVAIVEREKMGGTCLHRGCIPSKALLKSAETFHEIKSAESFGVLADNVRFDLALAQKNKTEIVAKLFQGLSGLMKKNRIDTYLGTGRLMGPSLFAPKSGTVAVENAASDVENLISQQLIIATGSRPRELDQLPADGQFILNSDQLLQMEKLPKSMLIIGGGVIGVEWASMLADFGTKVTIVEAADRLLPLEDEDVSLELSNQFKKRGITIHTSVNWKPELVKKDEAQGTVEMDIEHDGEAERLQAAQLLLCIGRQANLEGIGLGNTDVQLVNGVIKVNQWMQTAESHIYAVGDCIGGWQLAHAAAHEGIIAAEHICDGTPLLHDQAMMPRCVYSRPEIASFGWTEKQLKEQGIAYQSAKLPMSAIGKAWIHGNRKGWVKVLADEEKQTILGVHMIGSQVTDLISEVSLASLLEATPWEVAAAIHPHPSMSEAIADAMALLVHSKK